MRLAYYTALLLILGSIQSYGQFGVRTNYNLNSFSKSSSDLKPFFKEDNLLKNGFEIGVDYWFRLKKRRIEFMPEIYFSQDHSGIDGDFITDISLTRFGFDFNTHIYPLDLEEDCDCPTFSKQGPSFIKGFFFHFAPGVSYDQMSMKSTAGDVNENDGINLKLGAGFGLDIGISDFFTISPMYTFSHYFGTDWTIENFPTMVEPIVTTSSKSSHHHFGLRLGFRLDYK